MPFDGTGFGERHDRHDRSPAPRSIAGEILSWALSFSAVWLPFLAALLWVELH